MKCFVDNFYSKNNFKRRDGWMMGMKYLTSIELTASSCENASVNIALSSDLDQMT